MTLDVLTKTRSLQTTQNSNPISSPFLPQTMVLSLCANLIHRLLIDCLYFYSWLSLRRCVTPRWMSCPWWPTSHSSLMPSSSQVHHLDQRQTHSESGLMDQVSIESRSKYIVHKLICKRILIRAYSFLPRNTIYLRCVVFVWKHVAEWIGHWTQDQKVWSSIPTASHVY